MVEAQTAESVLVRLEAADGVVGAHLDGFKSRVLRPGAARSRVRHLYSTVWEQLVGNAAGLHAVEVLLIGSAVDVPSPQKKGTINKARMPQPAALVMAPRNMLGRSALLVAEAALLLLSAVVQVVAAPVAWLLTVRAQPILDCTMRVDPAEAGSWGLGRSSRMEAPLSRIRCIDVGSAQACEWQPAVWCRMLVHVVSGTAAELEHSCATAHTHVPRLAVAPPPSPSSLRLHLHARGAISNLVVEPLPAFIESGELPASEARLRVHAVSLNFRDVLNVLGEYPGDPGPPGGDCSGTVAATGDGVAHLCTGYLAFGLAHAPLASAALSHALLLSCMEQSLSFEQACTLPVVWSTVHVALSQSRLCAAQRLLVHAAVGGMGIAGIEAARWLHAAVDASASRPYKHVQLRRGLGVGSSCSSPDAAALGWGASWLQRGNRLHCALNSLSLDFISGSLALLGEVGAFCEIGKRSVWSEPRQLGSIGSTSACHTIALDAQMTDDPQWMQGVLCLLSWRAALDVAHGLPLKAFDLARGYEAAFRALLGGTTTGKVVMRVGWAAMASVCGSGDTQLLTGGTGGLGLLTARWLSQQGAYGVVLASRTGVLPVGGDGSLAAECVELRVSAARVLTERCNAADASETCHLLSSTWHKLSVAVGGVWHAAGVLADGTLAHQGAASLRRVFGPKAHGAVTLQRACATSVLRSCALFASVAALLGGAGQANYSAANCCLDSHAVWRRTSGTAGVSVQWGAWAEIGMAAGGVVRERLQASGFGLIGLAHGLAALQVATAPQGASVIAVVPARWDVVLGSVGMVPAFLSVIVPQRSTCCAPDCETTRILSLEAVLRMVRLTAGRHVDADAPMMESGVDSLGAVELRNLLQGVVHEAVLPSTIVLDHPTARQLVSVLQPTATARRLVSEAVSVLVERPSLPGRTAVLIEGLSALLPGLGEVPDRVLPSRLAASGYNAIATVPSARWSLSALPHASDPIASCRRHGGFAEGVHLFDQQAFLVPPREASAMDPQQRLVLEHGYAALHSTGIERAALGGSLTGVFLGIATSEFGALLAALPAGASAYAATGSSRSIASGRVAYVLGLHGPCISYDTACSAALTACQAGLRALQRDECITGAVAGVNLMLTPGLSTAFAIAGMTSVRGRSLTFDARADGYARGEACGALVLRTDACADWAWRALHGSVVRQDGRSASLTAPSGQAQQALLVAALADAGTTSHELALAEAHGTGTTLGDPIEAGALMESFIRGRGVESLPLAGVKASIGHAEAAAGMTGLLKIAVMLIGRWAAPNAQLRQINPHVKQTLYQSAGALPTQLAGIVKELPSAAGSLIGGVSSFGYSGTIVHAVLSRERGHDAAVSPAQLTPLVSTLHLRRLAFAWNEAVDHTERLKETRLAVRESGTLACHPCAAPERADAEPVVAVKAVKPYDTASGEAISVPTLLESYVRAHARSKAYMASYRCFLCDNRNISGFSPQFKETIHPIVAKHALGSHVVDVDGNDLIDVGGGFGPVIFGHNPPFVRDALQQMLAADAFALGFEHAIVGENSRKFCQLTGNERVTWVCTGTEATTLAMRLCRLHTRRRWIVVFSGSYHGHFDGFLGIPTTRPDNCVPQAGGIARGFVQDLVVLKNDESESLEWIAEHAAEIAGVFCEAVQNRNPRIVPRAFLCKLRELTAESGIVLVFDEVVTGFRIGPGGAQQELGIRADLATYGKVLGGGMPVGALGGRADIMAGVDGGVWQYGDASSPSGARTYFAGTARKSQLVSACRYLHVTRYLACRYLHATRFPTCY